MADFILIDGDKAVFLPGFAPAVVTVRPGDLRGSGPATFTGKKTCVDGDEKRVEVAGCVYMTPQYSIPGTGTLKIAALASDQKARKTTTGSKLVLLKGSRFTASFEVQSPAQQPPPAAGQPSPDPTGRYSGSGMFITANSEFQGNLTLRPTTTDFSCSARFHTLPSMPVAHDGTSQTKRLSAGIEPDYYVAVDERSPRDLLAFVRQYAETLNYFDNNNQLASDWGALSAGGSGLEPAVVEFMEAPEKFTSKEARLLNRPHFVLFLAFLKLFRLAQDRLNTLTREHLDFYFQQVLGMTRKPAIPDRVHVFVDLAVERSAGAARRTRCWPGERAGPGPTHLSHRPRR